MIMSRVVAFSAGLLVSAIGLVPFLPVWETRPYSNVDLLELRKDNGTVLIDTQFVKTDCQFSRLVVVGYSLDIPKSYPWVNIDGNSGNRIEGTQRLTLLVEVGEDRPETLEVRTRHLCETEIVDKVFIVVEVPYGKEDLEP